MGQLGYSPGDGWSELTTSAAADAMKFYSALMGWEDQGEPMPGHHVFGRDGEMLGGITDVPSDADLPRTPHWMPYLTVDNLNVALGKVHDLGGKIVMPPRCLPHDSGRIAIIQDPQGVATGMAEYTRKP
jgi:uncharacterized protein